MRRIPLNILIFLSIIFVSAIFIIDSFMYLIKFDISFIAVSLKSLREIIILLFIGGWYLILKRSFRLYDLNISQKLTRLIVILTLNFLIGALLGLLLHPAYTGTRSIIPDNYEAVVYSNIVGLMAILSLMPILFIARDLIFYKQKRTTRLYFNLFIGLLLGSSLVFFLEKRPHPLFAFDNSTPLHTILSISLIVIIVLLAFRNDWITYLSRKQKILFFFVGGAVLTEIFFLWNIVYSGHIRAYSDVVANFGNIIWHFLVIYGAFSLATLLVHLPTARAVDRKLKEVSSLYEFARQLNSELNYSKLTQLITQLTARVLESQTTWLELLDPEKHKLRVTSHINLSQQQILQNPFDELGGLNREMIQSQKPVLINDVTNNREFRQLLRWKGDLRALIAAPLFSNRNQLMGVIYAAKSQPYGFDIDDVSLIEAFANQFAIALENANLWKSSIERERLEQELKVAREVQLKLVPQSMPEVPGYDIDCYFLTAYEVGGDYYDTICFSDGNPGVVIGDVSGKGTSAAFYMAEFKGVIQTLARTTREPKELIILANRVFYSTIERQIFVTAIIGKLLPETNTFEFVRAGHSPVLHCSRTKGKSYYVQPAGLGIGLERGTLFEKIIALEKITLAPGDFLVLFTDGLVEIRNQSGEEFGEERLQALANDCEFGSAAEIKEKILDEIFNFTGDTPLHDDLTMIVIKRREETESEDRQDSEMQN